MGTKPKTVIRTFELPTRLAEKIDLIAEAEDLTPSDIVVDQLTLGLDELVEADPRLVAELLADIRGDEPEAARR
jgi:hypothetical protein